MRSLPGRGRQSLQLNHQFRQAGGLHFLHHFRPVNLHGAQGDIQPLRHFPIHHASPYQLRDVAFFRRERAVAAEGFMALPGCGRNPVCAFEGGDQRFSGDRFCRKSTAPYFICSTAIGTSPWPDRNTTASVLPRRRSSA